MITCDEVRELLDDYVDGAVGPETAALLEAHLTVCRSCSHDLELTRKVLEQARALPRGVSPVRDLWPEIAARIERSRVVALRRPPLRWVMLVGLAAAIVLGATAVLLSGPAGRRPAAAERPGGESAIRPAAATSQNFASEHDLERAARNLREVLQQRRDRLTPQTAKIIDENLDIIDQAIARMKRALDHEPGNRDLVTLLAETYQRKIDLLKTATELSRKS
jgi:anti-sigma factor RsiW